MESTLVNLELTRQIDDQRTLLNNVLFALENNGLAGIPEARQLIKPTIHSLQQKAIYDLKKSWISFNEYEMELEQYYSFLELHRRHLHNRNLARERDRNLVYYDGEVNRDGPRVVTLLETDDLPANSFLLEPQTSSFHVPPSLQNEAIQFTPGKMIISKSRVTKCLDPVTLELMEKPLMFVHVPTLTDYTDLIVKYPLTEICNLEHTLTKFLERAFFLGQSREQFTKVLREFISSEFPTFLFTLDTLTSPTAIFHQVIDLINCVDILSTVNASLRSLKREPHTPIFTTYHHYKGLMTLKIQKQEPTLPENKLKTKVTRISMNAICNFVHEKVKEQYLKYLETRQYSGDTVSESMCLEFLRTMENNHPEFRLQQTKFASDSVDLTRVDLFNTNVTSHMTTRRQAKQDPNFKHQRYEPPKRVKKPQQREKSKSPSQDNRDLTRSRSSSFDKRDRYRSPGQSSRNSRSPHSSPRTPRSRNSSNSSYKSLSRDNSPNRQNYGGQKTRYYNKDRNSRERQYSSERRDSRFRQRSRSWSGNREGKIENLQKKINELSKELSQMKLTCERCLSKNHDTLNCPIYFQTAETNCKRCGLGKHTNCKNSFQKR